MSEEAKSIITFTVFGEPASKANSRRWTGRLFIKSKKALEYSKAFEDQCPLLDPLMDGDLRVTIKIWYASRRPDLDPSLIFDLMQGYIYENDRAVREQHIFGYIDKENPRADILVEKIECPTETQRKEKRNTRNGAQKTRTK
jgi:Holliday junction resolvase RusA-like endonuclease